MVKLGLIRREETGSSRTVVPRLTTCGGENVLHVAIAIGPATASSVPAGNGRRHRRRSARGMDGRALRRDRDKGEGFQAHGRSPHREQAPTAVRRQEPRPPSPSLGFERSDKTVGHGDALHRLSLRILGRPPVATAGPTPQECSAELRVAHLCRPHVCVWTPLWTQEVFRELERAGSGASVCPAYLCGLSHAAGLYGVRGPGPVRFARSRRSDITLVFLTPSH